MSSFKCVLDFHVNDEVTVKKFFSDATGISIIIANMRGPVLHGYFVVPTEPYDDSGVPHALEHLIYGGSELYPYKGVIDIMANRYLSYGCAAVTKKDFTCFKLDIACNKGLNMLLPVYIDHILYPLLTEFCFTTEIYHINGEGKEGGVLYTKLVSRDHTCNSIAMLRLYQKLFSNSSLAFEAYGTADHLRGLTIDQVRDYHSKYYRPENLTIFISGRVEAEGVLDAVLEMEEKIISKGETGTACENIWKPVTKSLAETIIETVYYPNDEESNGTIYIGWHGPNCLTEYNELQACSVLLHYLCSSPISPLRRDLIEFDEPVASQIDFEIIEHHQALILIKLSGVSIDNIDKVDGLLMNIVTGFIVGDETIDMDRMRIIIQNYFYEKELNEMERQPHLHVFNKIKPVIIYGRLESDQNSVGENFIEARFDIGKLTMELMEKTEQNWNFLLNKIFVTNHHVTIQAVPSVAEQQKYAEAELERLDSLSKENSETTLELKQTVLEESIAQNEENPPEELITAAELLATAEINYHWSLRYNSMRQTTPPGIKLQKMPLYTEAYDLSTSFVYVTAIFSTDYIPFDLRMYLPLLIELLTNSPIQTDEDLIPLSQLSLAMEENLVSSNISIGLESLNNGSFLPFSNHFRISLQVQIDLYQQGVIWLRNLLYRTIFTPERIKVCTLKLLNKVCEARRNEKLVCRQLLDALFFDKSCNICLNSVVRQRKFLNMMLDSVGEPEQADEIVTKLNLLREMLINPDNKVSLHIATDWSKLSALGADFNSTWLDTFPLLDDNDEKKRLEVVPDYVYLDPYIFDTETNHHGVIVGRRSAKSTCLYQGINCINSYRDINLPALTVFLQYLTQPEGAIWRSLRGRGFAYTYSMDLLPNEGLLKLSIGEANNIVAAYREMKAVIEAQLSEDVEWNISLVESAKSTAIYNAVNTESTITELVDQSILAAYTNVPYDQNKVFIKKLQKVTIEQLNDVGQKYLSALFTDQVRTSCVCPIQQVDDIQQGLAGLGINLAIQPSLNGSILGD